MNGHMSRVSPDGLHIASGMGDWWLDDRHMGIGWHPVWWDEDRVLVNRGDGLWAYILDTDEHVEVVPGAQINSLAAGGGRYAWYGLGPQGTGIYRDDGSFRLGLDPAVSGDHLAWASGAGDALWLDDLCIRRAAIRTTITPPCVRAFELGVTWVEYHNGHLEAWGLLWGGEPQHLAPWRRDCYFVVPIVGPHGVPWTLVSDGVRLILVPWGAHVGYLVAEGEILHPDGAWTGGQWRVVWCDGQGHRFEAVAFSDAAQMDFLIDPRPPMPAPDVAFVLDAHETTVGAPVRARLVRRENVRTWRWLKGPTDGDPAVDLPVEGETHEYRFDRAGSYAVAVRAQGHPPDATHQAYRPGTEVLVTPRQPVRVDPVAAPPAPPPPARHLPGVQTGFGNPIVGTRDIYGELRAMAWHLMRVETYRAGPRVVNDFEYATDSALTRVILDEVRDADCEPIVIAGTSHVLGLPRWPRLKVELYNEADLAMTAAAYVQAIRPVLSLCYERGYDLYTSGISNPSPRSLDWLTEVLRALPAWVNCAYHRYPQNAWDVASVPRKPYRSRGEEFAALWAAAQTGMPAGQRRKVICTEFGFNQAAFKQGWWIFKRRRQLTDREVLDRVRAELELQRAAGISGSVYYQISEDPADTKNAFGLERWVDGAPVWKPVARVNL